MRYCNDADSPAPADHLNRDRLIRAFGKDAEGQSALNTDQLSDAMQQYIVLQNQADRNIFTRSLQIIRFLIK